MKLKKTSKDLMIARDRLELSPEPFSNIYSLWSIKSGNSLNLLALSHCAVATDPVLWLTNILKELFKL